MNPFHRPAFALLLAFVLAGCVKTSPSGSDSDEPGGQEPSLRQVSFSVESTVPLSVGMHVGVFAGGGGGCSDFVVKSIGYGGRTAVVSGKVLSDPQRSSIEVLYPYSADAVSASSYSHTVPGEQEPGRFMDYVCLKGSAAASGDDFSDICVRMEEETLFLDVRIENPKSRPVEAVRLEAGEDTLTARFTPPADAASLSVRFVLSPSEKAPSGASVIFSDLESERFVLSPMSGEMVRGGRLSQTLTLGKGEKRDIVTDGWFCAEPFSGVPTTDRMKFYEVSPRIFAKEQSLKAVRGRLGEISSLGANVIWLMPIFEQSQVRKPYGSPYSMKDFYKISPEYGTVEDLRNLVKEAHSKGMAVILDFVTNHTGADCEWVSEHPSWYMESYDPAYTDAALFKWNDPDPGLEAQMLHAMEYWIHAANIDGYRFDTVSPTREGGVTLDFFSKTLGELRRRCPGRTLIFLAESARPETLGAGFDLNYGWHFLDVLEGLFAGTQTVSSLFSTNKEEWDGVEKYGNAASTRMRYSTNHDHAAAASPLENYRSAEGSYAAFVLAGTMGGAPMIYSSQEIGYPTKLSIFQNGAKVMDWSAGESVRDRYRSLFTLGDSETLRKGSISRIVNTDVVSFTRSCQGETILVLVNVRDREVSFSLSDSLYSASWKDYFTSQSFAFTSRKLSPYEYKVLVKQ